MAQTQSKSANAAIANALASIAESLNHHTECLRSLNSRISKLEGKTTPATKAKTTRKATTKTKTTPKANLKTEPKVRVRTFLGVRSRYRDVKDINTPIFMNRAEKAALKTITEADGKWVRDGEGVRVFVVMKKGSPLHAKGFAFRD